jgi:hypothetical protein
MKYTGLATNSSKQKINNTKGNRVNYKKRYGQAKQKRILNQGLNRLNKVNCKNDSKKEYKSTYKTESVNANKKLAFT